MAKILLTLSISNLFLNYANFQALQELKNRKFVGTNQEATTMAFNNISIKNCFYIDRLICIYAADYDFFSPPNEQTSFKNFKNIGIPIIYYIYKYSAQYLYGQQLLKNQNNFEDSTQYLLTKSNFSNCIQILIYFLEKSAKSPYLNVLEWIMNCSIQQNQTISNSYIYKLQMPTCLSRLKNEDYPIQQLIVKSPKTDILTDNQRLQAIKSAQKELELMEEITSNFKDEEQILHFVSCICYIRIKDQLYIFTEYFPDGTLSDFFQKHQNEINNKLIYRMAQSLFMAINIFHSYGFVHRDLKPDNIFIKNAQDSFLIGFHIADFDQSCRAQQLQTGIIGTPDYAPPEFSKENGCFYPQSDIWQLGLILYQAAMQGRYIWKNIKQDLNQFNEQAIYQQIGNQYPYEFIQLIALCLSKNLSNRPNPQYIINQIKEIDRPHLIRSQSMYIPSQVLQNQQNKSRILLVPNNKPK